LKLVQEGDLALGVSN